MGFLNRKNAWILPGVFTASRSMATDAFTLKTDSSIGSDAARYTSLRATGSGSIW